MLNSDSFLKFRDAVKSQDTDSALILYNNLVKALKPLLDKNIRTSNEAKNSWFDNECLNKKKELRWLTKCTNRAKIIVYKNPFFNNNYKQLLRKKKLTSQKKV